VVLDEVGQVSSGCDFPDQATVVTDSASDFALLVECLQEEDAFVGTVVVSAFAPGEIEPWPVVSCSKTNAWVTVYDSATLESWSQTQFTPGFMNQQEAETIPSVAEAVFDLDVVAPTVINTVEHYKFRVRRLDGAIAIVLQETLGECTPQQAAGGSSCPPGCNAGPWWCACCSTQYAICNAIRSIAFIGPLLCSDCYQRCYVNCRNCPSNPCHSCDPCGLSWLLCRIVPFGHC